MKTLAFLLALSLYLLPNPTLSTPFNPIRLRTADVAVASDAPVLDAQGNELRLGGAYHISSTGRGAASGEVRLARIDSTTVCPSDVIVGQPLLIGDPIRIVPVDYNATVVLPSTFQRFEFFVPTTWFCINHVVWGIRFDNPSGRYFLTSDLFDRNLSGRFKIEVSDPSFNSYIITYCPFGSQRCYNVGQYFDESAGVTRLALSDSPFPVVFVKAS